MRHKGEPFSIEFMREDIEDISFEERVNRVPELKRKIKQKEAQIAELSMKDKAKDVELQKLRKGLADERAKNRSGFELKVMEYCESKKCSPGTAISETAKEYPWLHEDWLRGPRSLRIK